jgi:hypothetical protein
MLRWLDFVRRGRAADLRVRRRFLRIVWPSLFSPAAQRVRRVIFMVAALDPRSTVSWDWGLNRINWSSIN